MTTLLRSIVHSCVAALVLCLSVQVVCRHYRKHVGFLKRTATNLCLVGGCQGSHVHYISLRGRGDWLVMGCVGVVGPAKPSGRHAWSIPRCDTRPCQARCVASTALVLCVASVGPVDRKFALVLNKDQPHFLRGSGRAPYGHS